MKPIQLIYQELRYQHDPSVDGALAAALSTADEASLRFLALTILERKQPQGTVGLIHNYHLLPEDIQAQIIAISGDLYRPLREAATSKNNQGPINAIQIIALSKRPRLTYLVAERLIHGPAVLRGAASACLLQLAQWSATDTPNDIPPRIDSESASYLLKSIDDAIGAFGTHFQQPVLQAMAAVSPRYLPGAMRNFADWHHPVVEPVRKLLERPEDAATRRLLLILGRLPTLMNAALMGIHSSVQANKLGEVLESAHMLLIASMQRNILRLSDPDRFWPQPQQIMQMPPHQSRALARWVMALPLEPAERVVRLSMLNRSGDPGTRLAALRQLLVLGRDPQAEIQGVNAAICGYTNDTDAAIARIALRHLICCKWKDLAQLLLRLVNNGQPQVQKLASQYLSSVGFDRLWNAWPRLETKQQLAAGRAMIKIDPQFHKHVGDKLCFVDRPTRLRALAIIHVLNQGPTFEKALITLARDKDEVVASAAVRALGTTPSPVVIETLQASLEHNDSRVRANAVEALQETTSTDHIEQIIEMARNDEPRPRANAINALMELRSAEAMSSLAGMLAHQDSEFRTSALWLVDHMGLIAVARQVAEMSLDDPSDKVRTQAQVVVQRLIEQMSSTKKTMAATAAASSTAPAAASVGNAPVTVKPLAATSGSKA